jgi:cyclase
MAREHEMTGASLPWLERRQVLAGGLGALLGLALPGIGAATAAGSAGTQKLGDRLALISGLGGNVVALTGSEELLLVDSGAPQYARALQTQLHALGAGGRVHTLFNTHWHSDHTGSNEALARGGARIVAHEKTRLWLATDHWVPGEERYEKARPKEGQPTETFYTQGATTFGGEHIEYGYLLEAHTDGDIYVFFRDSNVLAVGGAVAAPDQDPELDWYAGGWLGGRLDAQALLLKLGNDDTRIVPAYGPAVARAQVKSEHDTLTILFDRIVEQIRKGYGAQDMLNAGILNGLSRTWSDPAKFMYAAHKGFWAHHNTLTHDIV